MDSAIGSGRWSRPLSIRFSTFPRTETPANFVADVVSVFVRHSDDIGTGRLEARLNSDQVLAKIAPGLVRIGFDVEVSKRTEDKIRRPVFFGENAQPDLQFEVDAWHPEWRAGLEVEAGRAWMGNAIYRDLVQALVMVDMDYLFLAVPQAYHYQTRGRRTISRDYEKTVSVSQTLYGHSRITMPFSLCVIGY